MMSREHGNRECWTWGRVPCDVQANASLRRLSNDNGWDDGWVRLHKTRGSRFDCRLFEGIVKRVYDKWKHDIMMLWCWVDQVRTGN